jgi:hypothetical protein
LQINWEIYKKNKKTSKLLFIAAINTELQPVVAGMALWVRV